MSSIQNIGFSNGWNEIEKGIVLGTKTAVDLKNYVKNFTGFYGEKLGMPTALANVDTDPKAAKAVEDWVKYRQAVATGTISKDNTFQTSYSKKTLKARIDTIKSRLDTMSNTQSQSQIRMQSVNGKYSEANELLSNLLKKMFDNGDGIISNMR